jgi:DedD protein
MKKRLVGAVVLVALAVIFVPMLLEEKEEPADTVNLERDIPAEPTTDYRADLIPAEEASQASTGTTTLEIPLETITEPVREERTEPVELATAEEVEEKKTKNEKWVIVEDTTKKSSKPSTQVAKTTGSKPASDTSRKGWAIQAGSFGQKANAENLMANLKLNGMDAYISEVQVADKTLYRVRVGPLANKQKAEQQLELVEKHFKLKGKILSP